MGRDPCLANPLAQMLSFKDFKDQSPYGIVVFSHFKKLTFKSLMTIHRATILLINQLQNSVLKKLKCSGWLPIQLLSTAMSA